MKSIIKKTLSAIRAAAFSLMVLALLAYLALLADTNSLKVYMDNIFRLEMSSEQTACRPEDVYNPNRSARSLYAEEKSSP